MNRSFKRIELCFGMNLAADCADLENVAGVAAAVGRTDWVATAGAWSADCLANFVDEG